ncbi:insulinase family protein [bacterium]|nr:MAG: insulinase family protein [bacterium]
MKIFPKLLTFALAALLAVSGCAGNKKLDPRTASFPVPAFTPPAIIEETLSGGAKVFLLPDRDIPLVRVYLSFRGGAIFDPPEKAGLSQVTGIAWRSGGTLARTPSEFDDLADSLAIEVGLSLGRQTGAAHLDVLSRDLETGLDLLAELLFTPAFGEERLALAMEQVKGTVLREEENPEALVFREFRRAMYRGTPRGVVPTVATVEAITREDAQKLHGELLKNSAWVIGVVGDFDPEAMKTLLEKRFGSLPGEGPSFIPPPPPAEPEPTMIVVPGKPGQATLLWADLAPSLESPQKTPLDLADYLLGGGGFQSRLMRRIRTDEGLSYSVSSFYSPFREFGVAGVSGQTSSQNLPKVWEIMAEEMKALSSDGVSEEELSRAKESMANSQIFRYRDNASILQRRMGLSLIGLPPDLAEKQFEELKATGREAVREAAKVYRPDSGILVVIGEVEEKNEVFRGFRVIKAE